MFSPGRDWKQRILSHRTPLLQLKIIKLKGYTSADSCCKALTLIAATNINWSYRPGECCPLRYEVSWDCRLSRDARCAPLRWPLGKHSSCVQRAWHTHRQTCCGSPDGYVRCSCKGPGYACWDGLPLSRRSSGITHLSSLPAGAEYGKVPCETSGGWRAAFIGVSVSGAIKFCQIPASRHCHS